MLDLMLCRHSNPQDDKIVGALRRGHSWSHHHASQHLPALCLGAVKVWMPCHKCLGYKPVTLVKVETLNVFKTCL